MRIEVAYAGAATVAAAASLPPDGPVVFDMGGYPVPIVPAMVGMLAALLVRIIVVTSPERRERSLPTYNVSITLLTMLGAATYITDHQLGPGQSFLTGVACGALGVGIIELARSQFATALKAGFATVFQTMFPPKP